jgi:hypothetical protein
VGESGEILSVKGRPRFACSHSVGCKIPVGSGGGRGSPLGRSGAPACPLVLLLIDPILAWLLVGMSGEGIRALWRRDVLGLL